MGVLRMVITGPNGSQAEHSSEPAPGITALIVSTGTSITGSTIAGVIAAPFQPGASVQPNNEPNSAVRQRMIRADVKLRAVTRSGREHSKATGTLA
jgi:hypothetical protein